MQSDNKDINHVSLQIDNIYQPLEVTFYTNTKNDQEDTDE